MTGLMLDIIVIVVVLLLLIFGIWRGMYKLLFGLVSSLLAIVLTFALVSSVTTLVVENTPLPQTFTKMIDAPLSNKLPNANVQIEYLDVDGDTVKELGYVADGIVHPMSDLLAGTPYSILSSTLEPIVAKNIADGESMSFVAVLSASIVGYLIYGIVAILLLIIFKIITWLFLRLLKKFVVASYFGNFVNKFVGAILGLAISVVIVWGSLAAIRLLGTYQWIIPINTLIDSSSLTKLLFNNNYLYNLLLQNFDVKGVIDAIIAKASSII